MLQLTASLLRCFLAGFFLCLLLICNQAAADATAPTYLQVLSVVNDMSGAGLVLNTTRNTAFPVPTIHYYPQAGGATIMTADFPGVVWNQPSKQFPVIAPLKEIRMGQIQTNPPVFRISIAGSDAVTLDKVCFRTVPGVLLIFFSTPESAPPLLSQSRTVESDSCAYIPEPAQGDDRNTPHAQVLTAVRWHAPPDNFKRTNLLKGLNITLDAGHGGSDPGAQRGTIQEKIITLDIVEKLSDMLSSFGARVTLTRNDDSFISVQDRVRLSLDAHPDIFLSVHINSMETNTSIHGIETYYRTPQSLPLAECIHDALVNKLEADDHGVRNARFYVINHTPIPSVLAEVGFISNPVERSSLASFNYQEKIASALKDGLVSYLARCKDADLANAPPSAALTAQATRIDYSVAPSTMPPVAPSRIDSATPAVATPHL